MENIPESNDRFLSRYADDHALVNSFNLDNNKIKQKIGNDIRKNIKTWMEENQLKMNDANAEFIVLGTSHSLKKNTLDNIEIGNWKNKNSLNIQN